MVEESFSNERKDNQELIDQTKKISITDQLCKKCGSCTMVCPHNILVYDDKKTIPRIHNQNECILCGHCMAICATDAIKHENFLKTRIKPINKSVYPTIEQLMNLIQSRRSIRAFNEKKVEKDLLELIIDSAKSSPSTSNSQDIEYVIVQDQMTLDKIVKILGEFYGKLVYLLKNPNVLDKLPENIKNNVIESKPLLPTFERIVNRIKSENDILQRGTPTLLIAHSLDKPFDWSLINASIALQNVSLVSSASGLGSCQLGYIETMINKDSQISELLNIPSDHNVYGVLALGYPKYTFNNWIEKKQPNVTWK